MLISELVTNLRDYFWRRPLHRMTESEDWPSVRVAATVAALKRLRAYEDEVLYTEDCRQLRDGLIKKATTHVERRGRILLSFKERRR